MDAARGKLSPIGLVQRVIEQLVRLLGLDELVRRSLLNYELNIVRVPLEIPIASEVVECHVLHLSDLHLDGVPDSGVRLCWMLEAVRCDLCIITGDFVDPAVSNLIEVEIRLRRLIDSINAPHGVFAVLGDHDPDELLAILQRVNIHVVTNKAQVLYLGLGIQLISASATAAQIRDRVRETVRGPVLCLAHSPDLIEEAVKHRADYFLCGHTHGGQICLPSGYPLVTRSRMARRFASGSWRYKSLRGYTSRGIGVCGRSPRIFCRPELTLHVLLCSRRSSAPA